MMNKPTLAAIAAAMTLAAVATPAMAQRDPAYAAARAAGQVGERVDGYIGIVGSPDAALQAIVNDINIRRRALYAERARAANATLDEYALTAGCQAILATRPGERYQGPSGGWLTRGAGAPQRDPRCP